MSFAYKFSKYPKVFKILAKSILSNESHISESVSKFQLFNVFTENSVFRH